MSRKKDIQEELKQASPFLSRLKMEDKDDGFTVHPAYFRELQDDILRRTTQQPAAPSRWALWQQTIDRLLPRVHPAAALAGLALMVAGVWWVMQPAGKVSGKQILADASEEELQTYVENHTEAFTTDLILEVAGSEADLDLLLPMDDISEEEADQLLDDLLEEMDASTLQEIL